MSEENKEVLVALLPRPSALEILKSEGWYHIPVETAPRRWPPKYVAFYQGKAFGAEEQFKIRYQGEVRNIEVVPRKVLFPNDIENQYKAERPYYRVDIRNLQLRYHPIPSLRPRRLVFIPTTLERFELAEQINDLFDGSPLEDRLWSALKYHNIRAERQWKIIVQDRNYFLDFAIFCKKGKLAIETDGYTYHFDDRNQIDHDTWRRNEIELDGWRILHYTSRQVRDDWNRYLPQIQRAVEQLGGEQTPEAYTRKTDEIRGRYIVDGEEPL